MHNSFKWMQYQIKLHFNRVTDAKKVLALLLIRSQSIMFIEQSVV